MRDVILKLLVIAVFFVSVEGVAAPDEETSFHQAHHVHVDGSAQQWYPDSDGSKHAGDDCEHFCHAHVVALTDRLPQISVPFTRQGAPAHADSSITRERTPPVPPPNI